MKHDIGHIIFDKFFDQATKKDFKLLADAHESVFSSGETVVKDIMKSNLYIVIDTLLVEKVGIIDFLVRNTRTFCSQNFLAK